MLGWLAKLVFADKNTQRWVFSHCWLYRRFEEKNHESKKHINFAVIAAFV